MNNSFCKKFDSYIGLIIDGEPITEKIRSQLENHLTQCKKCRDQLFQFKQVDGVIKGMMESKLQQHISTDELGALLDNQIKSITEKIRIEVHLKECQACQETYQQLKLLNQEWSNYEVQDLPIFPISSWFERLKKKLEDIYNAVSEKFNVDASNRWVYVTATVGAAAILCFFVIKILISPIDRIAPLDETAIVEKQDSLKTEQLADAQPQTKEESKKPADEVKKKTPDKWEKIKQVFAENFKPTPYLEEMLAYDVRSYSITVISPKIGEKITGNILFQWKEVEEPVYLKILDNKGAELFSFIPEGFKFVFTEKLDPGLYYWKLESEDDLLYVGKIFIGE